MLDAELARVVGAGPLLEAGEALQRGQQRPAAPVAQPQVALAVPARGLEKNPRFGHAVGGARVAEKLPGERPRRRQGRFEHGRDGGPAFQGLQIPREGNEIAPEGMLLEQRRGGARVTARERGAEAVEPPAYLVVRVSLVHRMRVSMMSAPTLSMMRARCGYEASADASAPAHFARLSFNSST